MFTLGSNQVWCYGVFSYLEIYSYWLRIWDSYKELEPSWNVVILTNPKPLIMQVIRLFPSAADLKMTWSSVVKIGQSLYREAPGMDVFRPDQKTPVPNFFLSGSYTKQVPHIPHPLRHTLLYKSLKTIILRLWKLTYEYGVDWSRTTLIVWRERRCQDDRHQLVSTKQARS